MESTFPRASTPPASVRVCAVLPIELALMLRLLDPVSKLSVCEVNELSSVSVVPEIRELELMRSASVLAGVAPVLQSAKLFQPVAVPLKVLVAPIAGRPDSRTTSATKGNAERPPAGRSAQ